VTYRRITFSDLSYLLICVFLCLNSGNNHRLYQNEGLSDV